MAVTKNQISPLSPEERLVGEVHEQYIEAYLAKEDLNLHEDWLTFEDYYQGNQNTPEDEYDPGSVTNIIGPLIDGIVADLVNTPTEIQLSGWSKSDKAVAPKAQAAIDWVWARNDMQFRRYDFEYNREKFGVGIWKVAFDGSTGLVGMPRIISVVPHNFFPDPRVTDFMDLEIGEYMIHAVMRPISYLRRIKEYADEAQYLQPIGSGTPYNPEPNSQHMQFFGRWARNQVLLLERWSIEPDGHLRKVVCVYGHPKPLYDSDKDPERREKGYYALDRYPFVVVPGYPRRDVIWGVGDVQRLIPTQDIINDIDDQIRLNMRLMGNLQIIVGVNSGIDPYRWTNEPGLKIPARLVNDWKPVQPLPLPAFIEARRLVALQYEAEQISGRTDAVLGRQPGSIRTTSGILALQQAALNRVALKQLLSRWGLEQVVQIVLDFITEYWTEEIELGSEIMFRGSDLKNIPILDKDGMPTGETKRADFDITVNIGDGMPLSKAFLYQTVIEGLQYGYLTREEARAVLKQVLNYPIIDPWKPVGELPPVSGAQHSQQATSETTAYNPMEALFGELLNGMGGMPSEQPQLSPFTDMGGMQ